MSPRAFGPCAVLCVATALFSACGSKATPAQPASATPRSAPLHFRYALTDGRTWLTSDALRGKPALLSFLTTYDLISQAQARFLNGIAQRRGKQVQVAAIVLESVENRPLMVAFHDGLELAYPLAIADADVISGEGPFGDVHVVPTTVVLDAEGRLVWKNVGLAREEAIEDVLGSLGGG